MPLENIMQNMINAWLPNFQTIVIHYDFTTPFCHFHSFFIINVIKQISSFCLSTHLSVCLCIHSIYKP